MNNVNGIYAIVNKINKKMYIGSSKHCAQRKKEHIRELNKNNHANVHLQNSWNKYGENNFEFIMLKKFENIDRKHLYEEEQIFIDSMKPKYNISTNVFQPDKEKQKSYRRIFEYLEMLEAEYDVDLIEDIKDNFHEFVFEEIKKDKIIPSVAMRVLWLFDKPKKPSVEDIRLHQQEVETADFYIMPLQKKCEECQFANWDTNVCSITNASNRFCRYDYWSV